MRIIIIIAIIIEVIATYDPKEVPTAIIGALGIVVTRWLTTWTRSPISDPQYILGVYKGSVTKDIWMDHLTVNLLIQPL